MCRYRNRTISTIAAVLYHMILNADPHPLSDKKLPPTAYFPPELLLQATQQELQEVGYHTAEESGKAQAFSASKRIFDYYIVPCHRLRNPFLTQAPTYHHVYGLLCVFSGRAQLEPEILLAALHYVTLAVSSGGVLLCKHTWERLVIAAICLACKMWDDSSCSLRSFATLLANDVDVATLVGLESALLDCLDFALFITPAQYKEYYLALSEFGKRVRDGCDRPALTSECPSAEFCNSRSPAFEAGMGGSGAAEQKAVSQRAQGTVECVPDAAPAPAKKADEPKQEIAFPAVWKAHLPLPRIDGLAQS